MTEPLVITEPGVYPDLPNDAYHSLRDALSSSGARTLANSTPAAFRHGVRENKPAWDMGHAAHLRVLGEGPELVEVEADDWRTKAAQQARKDAHARGAVPLLTRDIAVVDAMAAALRRHPLAAPLLEMPGDTEVSLFARDRVTEVMLRARPDRLTAHWCIDYKSTVDASPEAWKRSAFKWGYDQQAAFYLAVLALLDMPREAFLFVAQEKAPPFLVAVHQFDDDAMIRAEALNRRAISTFAECLATDTWPGYEPEVHTTSLPSYLARDLEYS